MAVSEELKALVGQMPDPDKRGMFTENVDKQEIEKAIAAICDGGRESAIGLIDMLGEPGSSDDVKPHYALHCVANHLLITKAEDARKELAGVFSAELASDRSDYVKSFLCQELQWIGSGDAAPALGQLLLDENLVEPASMALVAIREGAAEQFRAALSKAKGTCRLNVIQGLGALEDAQSAESLKAALRDEDREVRLAAGWALARLSDSGSVDVLINAADVDPGWERIQATKHCFLLAENLTASGNRQLAAKIYRQLRDTRTDPSEQYVREAAAKALEAA